MRHSVRTISFTGSSAEGRWYATTHYTDRRAPKTRKIPYSRFCQLQRRREALLTDYWAKYVPSQSLMGYHIRRRDEEGF